MSIQVFYANYFIDKGGKINQHREKLTALYIHILFKTHEAQTLESIHSWVRKDPMLSDSLKQQALSAFVDSQTHCLRTLQQSGEMKVDEKNMEHILSKAYELYNDAFTANLQPRISNLLVIAFQCLRPSEATTDLNSVLKFCDSMWTKKGIKRRKRQQKTPIVETTPQDT